MVIFCGVIDDIFGGAKLRNNGKVSVMYFILYLPYLMAAKATKGEWLRHSYKSIKMP
jgi:hypothetical protein